MSLNANKFTNPEAYDNTSVFSGHGNYGQNDTPGLAAGEMQKVMDELPRMVAKGVNDIIDTLLSTTDADSGADNIGATAVEGCTATTVQGILEYLAAGNNIHIPHGTTLPSNPQEGDVFLLHT